MFMLFIVIVLIHMCSNSKMTQQLNLYDVESDITYTIELNAEDYDRALRDQSFATALLYNAKSGDGPSLITETENTTAQEVTPETETESNHSSSSTINDAEERTTWTRNEILKLINIYKENENKFKSTTVRKEVFWAEVAAKIATKTADQVRNKFKYLKTMYLKKKDNMSTKATGKKKINFSYFEEMDEIFRHAPNVTPIAIASSSETVTEDVEPPAEADINKGKEKKSNITEKLQELNDMLTERETNAERRHKENLKRKDQALEKLNQLLALATSSKTDKN